jgi:hypothetical protein
MYSVKRLIQKSVLIEKKHEKFILDRSINLSRFVRKKLDEEMEKWQGI